MPPILDRRAIWLGLTAAGAMASAARAETAGAAFEGTWGGAVGDVTAQVIIAGGAIIGFYWGGDYRDGRDVTLAPDGRSLSFAFDGGRATLTLAGERKAEIVITEAGKVTRLTLARD